MTDSQIWVGPEPLRRHRVQRLTGTGAQSVDCATNPADAVTAACSGGLFGGVVHLRNIDALDPADLTRISRAVEQGAGPVIAECDKLLAPAKRALGAGFRIEQVTLGRGAAARRVLEDIAALLGVTISAANADEIARRCEGDPGRAVGVLEALAAGGIDHPDQALVSDLLGTSATPGFPWHLLTMLEQGRLDRAGDLIEQIDPIPAIGFLAKRLLTASLVAEDPEIGLDELDRLLGGVSDSAAAGARTLASRLGAGRCRELLGVVASADAAAKRGHPDSAVLLVVGHLARALHG